jgi:hypothetical protein
MGGKLQDGRGYDAPMEQHSEKSRALRHTLGIPHDFIMPEQADHVNQELLNKLLLRPRINRDQIGRLLHQICQIAASSIHCRPGDRQDLEQEALRVCLRKLSGYSRGTKTAFSYFLTIAKRAAMREVGKVTLQRKREKAVEDPDLVRPARGNSPSPNQLPPRWKDRSPINILDVHIGKATRASRNSKENGDKRLASLAAMTVVALQEYRLELAGEYLPIKTEILWFTKERRLKADVLDS